MEDNCLNIANELLSVVVPRLVVRLKQTELYEESSIKHKHPLQPQKKLKYMGGLGHRL